MNKPLVDEQGTCLALGRLHYPLRIRPVGSSAANVSTEGTYVVTDTSGQRPWSLQSDLAKILDPRGLKDNNPNGPPVERLD